MTSINPTQAWQDEEEAFICQGELSSFVSSGTIVPVGKAGEQAGTRPTCIWLSATHSGQKPSEEYCRREKSTLRRPPESPVFQCVGQAAWSRAIPYASPVEHQPLVVLPPAAAHTLLLLIVRRRQQRALFWTVCGCPESRGLCGSWFCTGRWIW